jgi:hypothetical protein
LSIWGTLPLTHFNFSQLPQVLIPAWCQFILRRFHPKIFAESSAHFGKVNNLSMTNYLSHTHTADTHFLSLHCLWYCHLVLDQLCMQAYHCF